MSQIGLNTNVAAMRAQRRLAENSLALSRTFERLASGLRINRASDDAAGLSIAAGLNVDSRVYSQAIRNGNDAISYLDIADGATSQLSNILIRLRELAIGAANGTLSLGQRRAMDQEANALTQEHNRIIQSTFFNGRLVISGSSETINTQLGYGSNGQIGFSVGNNLERGVGNLTMAAFSVAINAVNDNFIIDVNGDGHLDAIGADGGLSRVKVALGNGDGTFQADVNYNLGGGSVNGIAAGDVDGDGLVDIVASTFTALSRNVRIIYGTGGGAFGASANIDANGGVGTMYGVSLGDLDGDNLLEVVAMKTTGEIYVMHNNGNRSFGTGVAYTGSSNAGSTRPLTLHDMNGDGRLDIISADTAGTIGINLNIGNGTFGARTAIDALGGGQSNPIVGDFNHDGLPDIVATSTSAGGQVNLWFGNGDGTFQSRRSTSIPGSPSFVDAGDMNNDGHLDLALTYSGTTSRALIGDSSGTFSQQSLGTSVKNNVRLADINEDGILDLVGNFGGVGSVIVQLQNSTRVTTIQRLDLLTQTTARGSLSVIDAALQRLHKEKGSIGSTQSRIQTAINNLLQARENFDAAASQITDANIAEESANLVRNRILQQAASAILSQANQIPALALSLLRPNR